MDKQNKFIYTTQEAKSRAELRSKFKVFLKELIKYCNEFTNKETGLKASITQRSINKIASDEAINKSEMNGFSQEEHFEVAKDIGNLFENATLKETHADYKKNPNISNIHRFHIDGIVNEKDTTARITILERIDGVDRIYTIELQSPLLNTSCALEEEVAKSLSSDAVSHDDLSIYCDSDDETISQDSLNQTEAKEQGDNLSDSNESNESNESTQTTQKRRKQ